MNTPLEQQDSCCDRFQEWLEESTDARLPSATLENFLAAAPAELRAHTQACSDCHQAAADFLALRDLMRELCPVSEAGPWFAPRVMHAIVAREVEVSRVMSIWLAVPKFASRLSWVAATLLIVSGTWMYERPAPQRASAFASEHLFDPPSLPASNDDVLVSLKGQNQ
jgi:hypothetical protein